MNRDFIFQQDNPQNAIVHHGDSSPQAEAPIGLDFAFFRVLHHLANPLVPDDRPVGSAPGVEEIGGKFH
jgi:hypothetical protein